MSNKTGSPLKSNGSRSRTPYDHGLFLAPISDADQAAIKEQLIANAALQIEAFPRLQAQLLALFHKVSPVHLIAIVSQYGLFAPVSNQGIVEGTLMAGIQQHHVELLQAFALTLPEVQWGSLPATPTDIETVVATVTALADAFHARRFLEAQQIEEQRDRYQLLLREKMRLHTQMIRNWGHFGQVIDITRRLYAPLDTLISDTHGFSATDLIAVSHAMVTLHERRSSERFRKLTRVYAAKTIRASVRRYFSLFMPDEDPASFLAAIPADWSLESTRLRLVAYADIGLAQQACYTAADLAAETKLAETIVRRVLDALAFAPGALASADREHLFLSNPVWLRAAIRLDDQYFAPAPQSIFSFIHSIVRRLATTPELKKALEQRRARFLEQEVAAILRAALPCAEVQADIAWQFEGRVYQTDVVAKLDRAVVIAEAKSAALTDAALRGAPDRVRRHVRELIVEPSQQSLRLATLIWRAGQGDQEVKSLLAPFGPNFADVDEVVRVSITLDDFSIIASSEQELHLAGWLPNDVPIGCTIGIADLAAVADLLGDPTQLVHYLAERQRIQKGLQILGDEMDLLGFYLKSGFNIAAIERSEMRLSISGMSAEIDRWFMNRELGRKTPKPRLAMHPYFAKVIAEIRRHGRPGWLTITLDLLRAFDPEEQGKVVKALDELRIEVIRRRRETDRTATITITPPTNRQTAILFHVYPPEQAARRHEVCAQLGAMALETSQRDRCLLIGRDTAHWHEPYAYVGLAKI